ncbi:uncharacterized protein LOC144470037 isoform X2 [Augochlora pura]
MRTFLPIVWLLARVVLGTMEIENFSSMAHSPSERDDRLENETDKFGPTTNGLNGDSFATRTDQKEVEPGGVIKDESNVKLADYLKIVVKRGQEPTESLLDANEKGSSQEKKDPWAFWWGDRRINSNGQAQGIRRPIRVPFNSWGGKRGRLPFNNWFGKRGEFGEWNGKRGEFGEWNGKRGEFGEWNGKRGEFGEWNGKRGEFGGWNGKRGRDMYSESNRIADRTEPDQFTNDPNYNGDLSADADNVKRVADNWRQTPFHIWAGKRSKGAFDSWGGKRDQSENDRESNEDGGRDYQENLSHVHHILGIVTDGFPKEDKGRLQVGQNAIRGEIEMAAFDDGSDGKRNNIAYRIPTENIGNWFAQMCRLLANRKAQREHTKAVSFLPWHGKRSDSGFSPWGG